MSRYVIVFKFKTITQWCSATRARRRVTHNIISTRILSIRRFVYAEQLIIYDLFIFSFFHTKFDWQSFIDVLAEGTNITLTMDDVVFVRNPEYFLSLHSHIVNTPLEEIRKRIMFINL